MATRIGLISDTHGFHAREMVEYFIAGSGAEMLMVAGDLEDYRGYSVPTVFVRGNNESIPVLAEMRAGRRRVPGLRYLADGERLVVEGHSITGIGGKWGQPGDTSGQFIDRDALQALLRGPVPSMVVSHETPLVFPGHKDDLRLEQVVKAVAPALWVSGHRHRYAEGMIGRTRVVALGNRVHSWATVDVGASGISAPIRFTPVDLNYEALDARWSESRAREALLLKEMQRRPGRESLVYGVLEPDNEHARRWLRGMAA